MNSAWHSLNYADAIREGLAQALEMSDDVIVLGQLVDYPAGIFGTTRGLALEFGPDRVQDFPVSEAAMTSVALGSALEGMRPVIVHQRLDFALYSMDAIANWLALWCFKTEGRSPMPVTIRAVIGKGWGQGPQHSKSPHAWFAHLPGLKVAMPSNAVDAKGLLLESVFGEDPCLILESRSLFTAESEVPCDPYRIRYGKAATVRPGRDLTIVALGYLVPESLRAAKILAEEGIDAEIIDPRTLVPLDQDSICASVSRTGRLLVADPAWEFCGFSAEIVATVCERVGERLIARPVRVCFPNSHTPMSSPLEKAFYPDSESIVRKARVLMQSGKLR